MTDDTISRSAALNALADYIHHTDKVIGTEHPSADDCMDVAKSVLGEDELPPAQPMFEEVSPEEVSGAININPASLWPAHKLLTFLQKEGYVICKKTL